MLVFNAKQLIKNCFEQLELVEDLAKALANINTKIRDVPLSVIGRKAQ